MLQNFEWPKPEDENDNKVIRDVIEHNCHVVGIPAGEHGPRYSFSIGLFLRFEHPEFVILGIDHNAAATAINDLCALIAAGRRFKIGDFSEELFTGYRVAFVEVHHSFYAYYLGTAIWFYRCLAYRFPVLQVVWPDKQHKFPWEPGYEARYRPLQPILTTPEGEQGRKD
jgi:hypothetical protein